MLDLKRIREDTQFVRDRLSRRGKPDALENIDRLLELDAERRGLITQVETARARRNEVSPQVGKLKQAGKHEEAEPLMKEMRELGDQMKDSEARLADVENAVRDLLLNIPNLPEAAVPEGDESHNQLVREWGEERKFDFEPRPHWELGEQLGILDLPRGVKVAGSGFPLFVGLGARLERALINLMLDVHARQHGYTELSPPFMINYQSALGTGHLPKFGEDMYHVPEDGFYLVPTAEVPVTNLHAGELLEHTALPIKYVAYTPCFRREAGAHGKDTRGLLRVHQFDKVELLRFERPENGKAALEELTANAEKILQLLGLRYRVVLLAGGDLGFANAQTYDLEVWAPGVGKWLEVSSCSLYNDYQARRANIRFRPEPNAKPEFVYTLNGSGLALPRTLSALLETYQQSDGSIALPEVIAKYVGTDRIS
ncbi:MAG TPA: serine--tRNA ligase [Longimicrobiales bacterium]